MILAASALAAPGIMTPRSCRKSVRRLAISSRIVLLLPRPVLSLLGVSRFDNRQTGTSSTTLSGIVTRSPPPPQPLARRPQSSPNRGALGAGRSAAAQAIAQPAEPGAAVRRAVRLYLRAGACGGTAFHLRPGL